MAVAMRRPGFTLWIAWVCAGALGAAVAAAASQPGNEFLAGLGPSYWGTILLAAPLALLQLLVLRGLMGVSVIAAGMWFGLTLAASAAGAFATTGWYSVAPNVLPRLLGPETGMDVMFAVGDYMRPVIVGLAQGVVLAWAFRRTGIAVGWLVISVAAYAISIRLTFAITTTAFDLRTVGYVLPFVVFAALNAAMTGLVLVAITKMRRPVRSQEVAGLAI